jgi:hypothetical protein
MQRGDNVRALLAYHATTHFGTRENALFQSQQARLRYLALTTDEQEELAQHVIGEIENGADRLEKVLCCLACFQPGSLARFHLRLLELRVLYPGVIYHGATTDIGHNMISICEQGGYRNHALVALAWIGNETARAAFAEWRDNPPTWASELYVPPHQYSEQAGWVLTSDRKRRDLFHPVAFPLIPAAGRDGVKVGVPVGDTCKRCGNTLTGLIEFNAIERFLPTQGTGQVRIVTCHRCSCFGPLFFILGPDGRVIWQSANEAPVYPEWEPFPEFPLTVAGFTRHFLEAASWLFVPGISFSQIGGLPSWIQDAKYPTCPECTEKMPFIGQISNEDFIEYGEGIFYAFRCPRCNNSATMYQQT